MICSSVLHMVWFGHLAQGEGDAGDQPRCPVGHVRRVTPVRPGDHPAAVQEAGGAARAVIGGEPRGQGRPWAPGTLPVTAIVNVAAPIPARNST